MYDEPQPKDAFLLSSCFNVRVLEKMAMRVAGNAIITCLIYDISLFLPAQLSEEMGHLIRHQHCGELGDSLTLFGLKSDLKVDFGKSPLYLWRVK